ncbi:hypothetical protein DL98DRAFT_659203 [Cadophora sp. DSE1049]|nr:hypothetical protein DL98DRAFT_659203 [Cadophora sp. DSE1049]
MSTPAVQDGGELYIPVHLACIQLSHYFMEQMAKVRSAIRQQDTMSTMKVISIQHLWEVLCRRMPSSRPPCQEWVLPEPQDYLGGRNNRNVDCELEGDVESGELLEQNPMNISDLTTSILQNLQPMSPDTMMKGTDIENELNLKPRCDKETPFEDPMFLLFDLPKVRKDSAHSSDTYANDPNQEDTTHFVDKTASTQDASRLLSTNNKNFQTSVSKSPGFPINFQNAPLKCTYLHPPSWWLAALLTPTTFPFLPTLDKHRILAWEKQIHRDITRHWNWELLCRQLSQTNIRFTPNNTTPDPTLSLGLPLALRNRRRIWQLLEDARVGDVARKWEAEWAVADKERRAKWAAVQLPMGFDPTSRWPAPASVLPLS